MKKKALWKDIFSDIKGSLGRFFAIVAIIALGVAFFTGLKISPQNMKATADDYYDEHDFMDLKIVSTLGLTEEDVTAITALDGIADARGAYSLDVIAQDGERDIALRVHDFSNAEQINAPRLLEGRYPEKATECLVEIDNQNELDVALGSTLTLYSGKKNPLTDDLAQTEFEVVGFIQSPMYVSFEKGTTDVGSGQIRDFIMIPRENFKSDVYTEIYATIEETLPLNSYEDDYFDVVDPVEARVEAIASDREAARYDEIYDDAKAELDDGRAEYEAEKKQAEQELAEAAQEIADGKQALRDGEKELKDSEATFKEEIEKAEQEIADAEADLRDGEKDYQAGLATYKKEKQTAEAEFKKAETELKQAEDGIGSLKAAIGQIKATLNDPTLPQETINELKTQRSALQTTLTETKTEYEAGKSALAKQKEAFAKGEAEAQAAFAQAETELQAGAEHIGELEEAIAQLEAGLNNPDLPEEEAQQLQAQLDELTPALTGAKQAYEAGKQALAEQRATFQAEAEAAQAGFAQAEQALAEAEAGIAELEAGIAQLDATLANPQIPQAQQDELKAQLTDLRATLAETEQAYEVGKQALATGRARLQAGQADLDAAQQELVSGRSELAAAKETLAEETATAEAEIAEAKADLAEAKEELAAGETDYLEAKAEADEALAEALKDIEAGEAELADLDEAEWHVLNRKQHYSYVDYGDAAERIDALAKVFPTFFALVAALVTLTTMTRMVDEQRVNIGTLKALGYPRSDIIKKYIVYSLSATIIGTIIGVAIGYTVFPVIIFNAYGLMYAIPPVILSFNVTLAVIVALVAIILTTLTSFLASNKQLKENPSTLMRPKAPQMGKSVFLERFPFIWNRFNFNYKVTLRNLFRYKRRFFMTVFGIAGCTALIVAGFGIKDSIQTVVDQQFGTVFSYDMDVGLENGGERLLDDEPAILDYELVHTEGATMFFADEEKAITITVPEDKQAFADVIYLQNRSSGDTIDLDDGLVLTEGMSRELGLKQGDIITLENSNNEQVDVAVASIAENYTFNYIYLSKDQYEALFNHTLDYNRALSLLADDMAMSETELSNQLLKHDDIRSVSFTSTSQDDLVDTINSLNYVVILMTVSAGALAFVVLYNLTNINISERIREIATIKVLGFYNKEVSAYIYRENVFITLIGILTGLGIGIFLHKYIIMTVEMESLMLGLTLSKMSYVYAGLLTAGFALIVNIVMHFKLKNIEMVESLKSVD